jgi:NitT/TauT family transport system substrate-binding protein
MTSSRRAFGSRTALSLVVSFVLAGCAGGVPSGSPLPSTPVAPATGGPTVSASPTPVELTALEFLLPSPPEIRYYKLYLAQELGYFEEEGLDVKVTSVGGSPFVVQSVAAGTVAAGIATADAVILGYAQSPTYQGVYQHDTANIFDILVLEASPYQSVADLRGKTVGLADVVGGEALLLRLELAKIGLTVNQDVQMQALGFNHAAQLEALTSDRVQALIVAWNSQASAEVAGIDLRCLTCGGDPLASGPVIVNNDYLSANEQAIVGLGRAMAKASVFAAAKPESALLILEKVIPENFTNRQFAEVLMRYSIDRTKPPAASQEGMADLKAWENKMAALLLPGAETGLEGPVDLITLVNNSYVDQFNDFDAEAIKQEAITYQP